MKIGYLLGAFAVIAVTAFFIFYYDVDETENISVPGVGNSVDEGDSPDNGADAGDEEPGADDAANQMPSIDAETQEEEDDAN